MQFPLRDYQVEACDAVDRALGPDGFTDVLGKCATGGGKTKIGLELVRRRLAKGQRCLWIAHRSELIDQPIERFVLDYPELGMGYVGKVMADMDQADAPFVVASVQTLANLNRLKRILAHGPIDFVVVDECHHAVASTYVQTIVMLRMANLGLRHLGLTATPKRTDGSGLAAMYQHVAFDFNVKFLIERGWLCPFRAFAVETGISLKGIRTKDGDFEQKKLARVFDVDNAFELVAETHRKHAADRQAIAFTVSVAGAYALAQKFRDLGFAAEACDGTTHRDVRADVLRRFRAGEIQVLCNCMLFTEGLDLPTTAALHMCRPTKSDLLYIQMLGRGLRTHPAKTDCMVFDYIPVERDVLMAGDVLGKPRQQRLVEQKAAKAGILVSAFSFTGNGNGIDGDPDELVLRPLNLLAQQKHAWFFSDGLSTLGLGTGRDGVSRTLTITKPHAVDGKHRLLLIAKHVHERGESVFVLARDEDFGALAEQGGAYADRYGVATLALRDRDWQGMPATDKQKSLLGRLAGLADQPLEEATLADLSRGDASKVIDHLNARLAIARRVQKLNAGAAR